MSESQNRAGFHAPTGASLVSNVEDLARQAERPKRLNAHTCITRLDELETAEASTAESSEAPAPLSVPSKMIAFFAPKGGVGATSLAINTAGCLAHLQRQTVVADMDLQLGSVPVSLNVTPERSIAELVVETQNDGSGPIRSGLDHHQSGLCVVAQNERIEELSMVTPEKMPRFFDALGQTFEFVFVDGLRDFSDLSVAVMDLAHEIVMVATQDVPAIRASSRAMRVFRRLGYGPERIKFVLNRYHRKSPVTLEAIQNALGMPISAVVRNDFPVMEQSLNHGFLVNDLRPGSGLAEDLNLLAMQLGNMEPPKPKGFFARIFGRG